MGIGFRIKEARNLLNLTQEELAQKLGVTKGAVANYENETSHPKEPIMYKLFDALQVDANYLFQDEMGSNYPMKVSYNEMEYIKKYRFISEYSPNGAKVIDTVLDREYTIADQLKEQNERLKNAEPESAPMRLINYYYRLASAGTGQLIFDMPPTKRIEIPDLPEYHKADYAIGVNGKSMEPIYYENDTLLVEMTEQIEIGEIGIFLVNNECYVKKLGRNELISLNPNYENIPLNETAHCMGRVIAKL